MLRAHTYNLGHEVTKAVFVTFVIILVSLMLATAAADDGQGTRTAPPTLPAGINQWAVPMDLDPAVESLSTNAVPQDDLGVCMNAWTAIQLRDDGDVARSLEAWRQVQLPYGGETWRLTAMAEAAFTLGDMELTESFADTALMLNPENPVAHYLLGKVELVRASQAYPWMELERPHIRFVSLGPQDPVLAPRDVHEYDALTHFAAAGALGEQLDLATPLMGVDTVLPRPGDMAMPVVSPTVGDVLDAAKMNDYEANSHRFAARLLVKRDFLDQAEYQLDSAAEDGAWVAKDYMRISKKHLDSGRDADAGRLLVKASTQTVGSLLNSDFLNTCAEQWGGVGE